MTPPTATPRQPRRLRVAGEDWDALHRLILRSFAGMAGRIDPPSSALRLSAAALAAKAGDEIGLVIEDGGRPLACAFLDRRAECLYVGKLAVEPQFQRAGLGTSLIAEAERIARDLGCDWLELQTRVELVENHRYFSGRGFAKIGEGSHAGYSRPTWIVMRKPVARGSIG